MILPSPSSLFSPSLSYMETGAGSSGGMSGPASITLKIAFLVPEDRRTGTYFRFHNLAVALQELGHTVTVYSQTSRNRLRGTREQRDGVPYVLSPTVPGDRWILPPTNPFSFARRLFTRVEPAHVYHLFQPYPTAAWLWLWLRRRRKSRFFYDWDDFWINDEFGLKNPRGIRKRWVAKTVGYLERALPARADAVTTVSHSLAALAREWGARKTAVIHNGVWPGKPGSRESRRRFGLPPEAFCVGLMGWSGEIDWCLEAISRFQNVFPSLHLAITGRDPREKLAACPQIAGRVHYLGYLTDEDFAHFNDAIDLGLVPMRNSDFNKYRLPYKLTDHLAGGVPVLCSRIGEAVRLADKLDGIHLCEPTLQGWLQGFREVVADITAGRISRRVPTIRIQQEFSWVEMARRTAALYEETLLGRTAPRYQRS